MANTPSSGTASLSKSAAIIHTDLGPIGGAVGEIEEYDTKRLWPIRITQSEGGVFEIEFAYRLGEMDERLKDVEFINGYEQLVEVELEAPSGTPNILLGWGELLAQELRVAPDGETAFITARISNPHFGKPLIGMHVLNHAIPDPPLLDTDPLIHEGQIVFNPEIDGQIVGNATDPRVAVHKTYDDPDSDLMILTLWVNPESMRTAAARILQRNYSSIKWTLKEAIHSLCWVCNPLEEFVKNPELSELDAIEADEVTLRNIVLPAGEYLPELLSQLLKPHGYSWYVQPGRNEDPNSPDYGTTENRIKIFKLAKGVQKTVYQPSPGTTLVAGGPQNCIEWEVRESFDELRNQVTALGGLIEREVTIELFRGWDDALDDLGLEEIGKEGEQHERHRDVWRLWVGNEAGDWTDTRTEITDEPDLSGVLGAAVGVHRRPIGDCLTLAEKLDGDTKRRPPLIEWRVRPEKEIVTLTLHGNAIPLTPVTATWTLNWKRGGTTHTVGPYDETAGINTILFDIEDIEADLETGYGTFPLSNSITLQYIDNTQAPDFWIEGEFEGGLNPGISVRSNAWEPIPDGWGPVLLQDQCGVYFNGDKAVEDLKGASDARIRITGTITGDTRITYTSPMEATSPFAKEHEMVVDVSDRFFDRKVQRTGRYMSSLIGIRQTSDLSGADEVDSTTEIETYADNLKAIEDAVNITGKLKLTGIHLGYRISDLITEINGRKISLNRKASDTGLTQYVQVTVIEHVFHPEQRTILHLLPLDQTEAALMSMAKRRRRRR